MALRLLYFPLRGRGDCIRVILHAAGVPFSEESPDFASMKAAAGSKTYPFGQLPVLVDGELHVAQQDAIVRHLARKLHFYGKDEVEMAVVDMVLLGVEDVRRKYLDLVYGQELNEAAKKEYVAKHVNPSSMHDRVGGAHFAYLEALLDRHAGKDGYAVGDGFTVADVLLFDIVDAHLRPAMCPEELRANYPKLVKHHEFVSQIKGIKEYLEGPTRPSKVNGNGLG
eukprot:jgi/Pico_ML_1/51401/g208.t1